MRVAECVGRRLRDAHRVRDGHETTGCELAHRLAFDQRKGDKRTPVSLAVLVDGDNARVIERSHSACFVEESPTNLAGVGETFVQQLEGHGATEENVLRSPDDRDATLTEL